VFPLQRIQKIKAILLESQQVDIHTLIKSLSVSLSTLRRDLDHLVEEGYIVKYHGGVILNPILVKGKDYDQTDLDPVIGQKRIVGALAANLIFDKDVIFIGPGNSCYELAVNIKTKNELTVITNSFHVSNELCRAHNIKVIFLGGDVAVENNKSFTIGNIANIVTEGLFIRKCFITVNGVSLEYGYSVNNRFLAEMYNNLLDVSDSFTILADSSKFGLRAFKKLCEFDQIKQLVTDRQPDAEYCGYSQKHGIKLLFPQKKVL
jgi:DeoR/GlpR family transcriptional regulator of sugar metabolism